MKQLILFILLITSFTGCVTEDDPVNDGIVSGDPLPAFSAALNTGDTVTTASLRGKVALIEFFNTSCSDCREALPAINEIYREFGGNDDVVVIAIAREETEASIETFWKDHSMTLPYSPQPDRTIYNLFATTGIPRTYIADRSGIVIYTYGDTALPSAEELRSRIQSLLSK